MKLAVVFVIALSVFMATVQAFTPSRTLFSRSQYLQRRLGKIDSNVRLLATLAGAPPAVLSKEKMYSIAQQNFQAWNQALKDKDHKRAASYYSNTDLSFLPTVSPEFIRDTHSAEQYFMAFIENLPDGEITSDAVQCFDTQSYLHTGLYTFMTGPENSRTPVQARFSYMWRYIGKQWKIIHHHSSIVPGQIAKAFKNEEMYPIAQENFAKWNQGLKDKDYEKVVSLYSSTDLSFLPTVSPNFIRDPKSAKEYFIAFLQKQPDGTITNDNVQAYSDDAYLHTGMYTFMTGPDDNRQPVEARFSYMWRKIDGEWKIVHHHSSAVPKAAGATDDEMSSEEMYPVAQENFRAWNDALQTKDYQKVAALYSASDLSFLPTVSPEFVRDTKSTEEYFKNFLQKIPFGTITADDVQTYGPNAYLHTGMYTFMVGPDNDRQAVQARFSYMWRKIDGVWKIVHHHSSAVPGIAAPVITAEDMYPVAQANFKAWNDALQTKDYQKVAALYSASELSFLPTVSGEFVRDTKSTEEYFKAFLQKIPFGTITADDVQPYGADAYLHTGMYTFMVGPEDARQAVQARFSYMWRKVDGKWRIVHHHSSTTPGANVPKEVTAEDMYPVAQANFKTWNDALVAKNYQKVASLYSSKDLSFLPTVSPNFIRDGKEAEKYFVDFVQKLPDGIITSDDVKPFGPDAYLHTGMYTFNVGPADNRQPVNARFSYMWRKIDGEWKIVHHHSSAVPKAPGSQEAENTAEVMYPIAQENFKTWNDALVEKNYQKVAGLYASKDLSFLPTVSPKFIRDADEAEKYFIDFVKKLPDGTITADDVQPYGPDAYLHTGMYTFMVGPQNDRQPVQARFSYMWRKLDGVWKIVHHHSSAVPAGAAPADTDDEDVYALAQENFKSWNDALVAKDYAKVAGHYCPDELSFLPTVSPKFIQDAASTKQYFVDFVQKLPSGTIKQDNVQKFGPNAYLHTGLYTFMTGPATDRQPVKARFSYMWKKKADGWKIVHHHSSALPQGSAPQPTPEAEDAAGFSITTAEDKEAIPELAKKTGYDNFLKGMFSKN